MTGKYLISTDEWFIAPDGKQYKAAWGEIEIVEDSFLGLKTNRMSTNWFAKVGSEDNHIIIAGCQIHYAAKCKNEPVTTEIEDWTANAADGIKKYKSPSRIYIAE